MSAYARVLTLQPTHAEAALYLGILQAQQGEDAAAEGSYKRLWRPSPTSLKRSIIWRSSIKRNKNSRRRLTS